MIAMLANMQLRNKIILAFTLMFVGFAGMSVYALNQLRQIDQVTVNIQKNLLPSIQIPDAINTALSNFRIEQGKHVLSTVKEDMDLAEQKMQMIDATLNTLRRKYEALDRGQDAIKEYDGFAREWSAYTAQHKQIVELSRDNKNVEAAKLFRQSQDIFDRAAEHLDNVVEINSGEAADSRTAGDQLLSRTKQVLMMAAAAVAALFLAIGVLLVRSISTPVKRLTAAMNSMCAQDYQVDLPQIDRRDEIGEMTKSVLVFRDSLIEADRLNAEQEKARLAELERARNLADMASGFDRQVQEMLTIVASASTELQRTAEGMNESAAESQRQSDMAANSAEETSANIHTVAAAAEELSSSISEISQQVNRSADISRKAMEDALQTNQLVGGLAEAAQNINKVISLIDEIASQTNLLALNATIEAARAGDAGKGFAVVASEVKTLATQTSKATTDITTQIAAMQAATQSTVQAIGKIQGTINEVSEISVGIASAIEEQTAATNEIARNVAQASAGSTQLSSNIVNVSRMAGDTGAAAAQVLASASEMAAQSEQLRAEVERFLHGIQAA